MAGVATQTGRMERSGGFGRTRKLDPSPAAVELHRSIEIWVNEGGAGGEANGERGSLAKTRFA